MSTISKIYSWSQSTSASGLLLKVTLVIIMHKLSSLDYNKKKGYSRFYFKNINLFVDLNWIFFLNFYNATLSYTVGEYQVEQEIILYAVAFRWMDKDLIRARGFCLSNVIPTSDFDIIGWTFFAWFSS